MKIHENKIITSDKSNLKEWLKIHSTEAGTLYEAEPSKIIFIFMYEAKGEAKEVKAVGNSQHA